MFWNKVWLKLFRFFSVYCQVIAVITMVRLITAFVCALVANADYVCTNGPYWNECQCLTMVDSSPMFDGRSVLSLPNIDFNDDAQKYFTFTSGGPGGGGLAYTPPGVEKLCVTHPDEESPVPFPGRPVIDEAPCDYYSEGGIFITLTTGELYHVGKSQTNETRECLEANLIPEHEEYISVGDCSSTWTISSTPSCSSQSEMVIS